MCASWQLVCVSSGPLSRRALAAADRYFLHKPDQTRHNWSALSTSEDLACCLASIWLPHFGSRRDVGCEFKHCRAPK